jgi:hypothetical protein
MAGQVSLNSLIEALANAVIEAQDHIEQHQMSNIRRYFEPDNRPISIFVKTPSTHPDAEAGDDTEPKVPHCWRWSPATRSGSKTWKSALMPISPTSKNLRKIRNRQT